MNVNKIKFEGNVLHSDIVFLPGRNSVSVCRIVLKSDTLACMPVFCFGEMAVGVKKEIHDQDVVRVSGKIVTYIFHDDFDTPKNMTMILAKEIRINNRSFVNTKGEESMDEACLRDLCESNMLPVPEEDYELIARELTEISW